MHLPMSKEAFEKPKTTTTKNTLFIYLFAF